MPQAFSPDHLLYVADWLRFEQKDFDADTWTDWSNLVEARCRASVSRAYYALFLSLKARLMCERPDWLRNPESFPKASVHAKLLKALQTKLPGTHRLPGDFKDMKRDREHADYTLAANLIRPEEASDACDKLEEVLSDVVPTVTGAEWKQIADELWDLDHT